MPRQPQPEQSVVLYARVSSKEQEQGFSIAAQLRLLHDYAHQKGYTIAGEFVDVETAKRSGRTGFNQMLDFVRKTGLRRVLVEKTDRLYRNIKDWVTIDELGLNLHFVKENVVLTPDSRSSDKLMHGMKVLMAKNYVDNLSEETRKGMLEKARSGLWPSNAPAGYVNSAAPDGKRIIVPDPETAPVITQIFEWFATGQYSVRTLAAKARQSGLRLSGDKLHASEVHLVLRKRIYSGDFDWDGTTYQGTHTPLVSRAVWERTQQILDGKQHRKQRKHDFVYSGIVTCGHCGCAMVAEIKKGRYVYYHCTDGKGTNCPEPYTREERLTEELRKVLGELVIPKAVTDWLRAELRDSDVSETRAREQALQRARLESDRISKRIDSMYLDKLDERITAAFFDEKAAEWRAEQSRLERRIAEMRQCARSFDDAIRDVEDTSAICRAFPDQPVAEQRRLLKVLVERATWKGGELETTFKMPFEKLRLSNRGSARKDLGCGAETADLKIWLPTKRRKE